MANRAAAARVTLADGNTRPVTGTSVPAGESIAIKNLSTSNSMDVGPAGLTNGQGFPIAPGETLTLDFLNGRSLYIVGTAGDTYAYLVTSP